MNIKVYQSKIAKYAGHTEGPWEPHDTGLRRSGLPEHQIHWSEYGECVAEVVHGAENAALIADAPYLACEVERLRELCGELVGALNGLMTNPSINLADKVYDVRDREGKGWDGPDVAAWSNSLRAAEEALAKAKGGDE